MIGAKPLHIRFNKRDRFIRIYNGMEKYVGIYSKIIYLFYQNQKMFLWLFAYRKILAFYNVIIVIKSVLNKDQNHYHHP